MSERTDLTRLVSLVKELPIYETGLRLFYSERFVRTRDIFFVIFAASYSCQFIHSLYDRGPSRLFAQLYDKCRQRFYSCALSLPFLKQKFQKKIDEGARKLEAVGNFFPKDEKWQKLLPTEGFSEEEILEQLRALSKRKEVDWENGKVSGSVYRGKGQDDEKVLSEVMKLFGLSNLLHPDMFPAINKMEREIVSMTLALFNAPPEAAGCFTMGGTESIILACRTYKQEAFKRKGITRPEMIVPISAHAAFDKAAEYFGIELIHIPLDKDFRVDLKAVRKAISSNTILITGSAMNYPHGMIDDIEQLSSLAKANNIGLHVDCCLGGFLVPFMEESGFKLPLFDFRLDGVTSISCDTHKYGCTIKGSSVVMYRTRELFKSQFHIYPDWTGGIYATHSIQGSRPGVLVAACWAALMLRGRTFYVNQAKEIVDTAMAIKVGARQIPFIEVLGDPLVSVVSFRSSSPDINSLNIADAMQARGWALNKLQHPSAFHIACTSRTVGLETQFLEDLRASVLEVQENPTKFSSDSNAFYGANADMQGTGLNKQLVEAYLSGLLKV
ncbi:Dihydrosphingosine phosphate lyase [Entomophthora muscae]|uniref:Dihydrosphingosine phosphate lyase n=1 Tax=Entomophthora muscae TaxID=34485 RepID=A0ACC2ST99_9FUNG|nr:Dihydrosphingosine phosphate lyase [Entomophthora muscae]